MLPKLNCILLIDDDPTTNFLNKRLIRKLGITETIKVAETGKDGLEYLQQAMDGSEDCPVPTLIFLDLNMPLVDGWEFLEEYKNYPLHFREKMVVAMLTTSLRPIDRTRAEEDENVKQFIAKPLTKESLEELLTTYFQER